MLGRVEGLPKSVAPLMNVARSEASDFKPHKF
jgi:hypothetical protein